MLDALETELGDGSAAAGVRTELEALASVLEQHNAKEEPIVYPVADTALSSYDTTVIKDFLASGTMPYGWTCARAG